MYTLLSCLNSVMAEQPDNIAIFNEGNGKAMVEKVQRMHDDAKVQQLSTNVLGCVEHDAQQAKERAKQRRRGKPKRTATVLGCGCDLQEPVAGFALVWPTLGLDSRQAAAKKVPTCLLEGTLALA